MFPLTLGSVLRVLSAVAETEFLGTAGPSASQSLGLQPSILSLCPSSTYLDWESQLHRIQDLISILASQLVLLRVPQTPVWESLLVQACSLL